MTELLIIQTPTQKRAEILGQIKAYEAQIAHAKHDLARGGSGNLNSRDKWIFRTTAA